MFGHILLHYVSRIIDHYILILLQKPGLSIPYKLIIEIGKFQIMKRVKLQYNTEYNVPPPKYSGQCNAPN